MLILIRVILVVVLASSTSAVAFSFKPKQREILASSTMCKKVYSNRGEAAGLVLPSQSEDEKTLIWATGGWHFCGGAILLRRAENTFGDERKDLVKRALVEIDYSYQKIQKTSYWAAEMGTVRARAFKVLGKYDKTFEQLDLVIRDHADYKPAYTLYGLTYYEQKQYSRAADYFKKAQESGEDAQITYFLGLTAFKMGDIESARNYSAQAKRLGYPLQGLDEMLSAVE